MMFNQYHERTFYYLMLLTLIGYLLIAFIELIIFTIKKLASKDKGRFTWKYYGFRLFRAYLIITPIYILVVIRYF
jgi:hypothetical protein